MYKHFTPTSDTTYAAEIIKKSDFYYALDIIYGIYKRPRGYKAL